MSSPLVSSCCHQSGNLSKHSQSDPPIISVQPTVRDIQQPSVIDEELQSVLDELSSIADAAPTHSHSLNPPAASEDPPPI